MFARILLLCPLLPLVRRADIVLSGLLADACVVSQGILLDEVQILSLCQDLGIVIAFGDFL